MKISFITLTRTLQKEKNKIKPLTKPLMIPFFYCCHLITGPEKQMNVIHKERGNSYTKFFTLINATINNKDMLWLSCYIIKMTCPPLYYSRIYLIFF